MPRDDNKRDFVPTFPLWFIVTTSSDEIPHAAVHAIDIGGYICVALFTERIHAERHVEKEELTIRRLLRLENIDDLSSFSTTLTKAGLTHVAFDPADIGEPTSYPVLSIDDAMRRLSGN